MMKNKLRRDIFVIIFLLLVACIALAVPLAFSNPRWLLAPALLVVFALVVAVHPPAAALCGRYAVRNQL